jgi:hypothetical protein
LDRALCSRVLMLLLMPASLHRRKRAWSWAGVVGSGALAGGPVDTSLGREGARRYRRCKNPIVRLGRARAADGRGAEAYKGKPVVITAKERMGVKSAK